MQAVSGQVQGQVQAQVAGRDIDDVGPEAGRQEPGESMQGNRADPATQVREDAARRAPRGEATRAAEHSGVGAAEQQRAASAVLAVL